MLLEAYLWELNQSLGIYIPLIVVNCIILGRAESYASKNPVAPSIFDGLGMGLGFTIGLTVIGLFRELIGSGTLFKVAVMPDSYEPLKIFVNPPGAFLVLAILTALQNKFKFRAEAIVITKITAPPIPAAVFVRLETPKNGHIPRNWLNTTLLTSAAPISTKIISFICHPPLSYSLLPVLLILSFHDFQYR